MTKATKEFKSGLTLGRKKAVKTSTLEVEEIDRVAEEIHKKKNESDETTEQVKQTKEKKINKKKKAALKVTQEEEKTKKAGVVLALPLFKKMKQRAVERDLTISEYFKDLLEADLKKQ